MNDIVERIKTYGRNLDLNEIIQNFEVKENRGSDVMHKNVEDLLSQTIDAIKKKIEKENRKTKDRESS